MPDALVLTFERALGVVFTALLFLACGEPPTRPDVLLLVVDTLRADHLGLHGYARPTSPELDRFSRGAIVFEEVVAPAPWTLPSVASLLTGTYPSMHGLLAKRGDRTSTRLRAGLATLAETFSDAGYRTVAIVSNPWVDTAGHGLQRGFEQYQSALNEDADALHARAREILNDDDPRPVFLYLHYMDVHGPYRAARDPTEPDLGRVASEYRRDVTSAEFEAIPRYLRIGEVSRLGVYLDAYDRGIRRWDASFGGFVDWLEETGRLDTSVVSLVADHGEEFLEHGGWHHGATVFQEQVRVPWILRLPRIPPARVDARTVSLIDVGPTLLAFAGIRAPETMQGVDQRGDVDPQRAVYSESHIRRGFVLRERPVIAMQRGGRKWVVDARAELCFDRRQDPGERAPQSCPPARFEEARRWSEHTRRRGEELGEVREFEMSPQDSARLQELGYGE
jgi:arylsulfatase